MCREDEKGIPGFGGETSGRDHLEKLGIEGRIILKSIFKNWDGMHGLN